MPPTSSFVLSQVQRVSVATGAATPVASNLGLEALRFSGRLSSSPDGSKAAFEATISSGATRIFVMELATQHVTMATAPGTPTASDHSPTWVDATTLGFCSDDGLYTTSLSLSNRTLVIPDGIECWYAP